MTLRPRIRVGFFVLAACVYVIVTEMWGLLFALGAGHGGPGLPSLIPASPFSLGFSPSLKAALLNIPLSVGSCLLWPVVAWLLAERASRRALITILSIHYVGVVLLLVERRSEVVEYGFGYVLFGTLPYLIGQAIVWKSLLSRAAVPTLGPDNREDATGKE